MTTRPAHADSDQIRTEILDAAEQRMRTFGYGKTTMVEIATDANMSAANLYRYFENKLDIGAALAQRCFRERYSVLAQVVQQSDPSAIEMSAAEKLEAFVIASLRYTYNEFSETPQINELVDIIVAERPDVVQAKIKTDLELIELILNEGVATGEFAISDMKTTCQSVQHAIVKFNVPLFMSMYPLDEFEQHARALVNLLVHGLANHK